MLFRSTKPLPWFIQVPLIAKQPEETLRPPANVDVAVPVWLIARTSRPPAKVEVAVEVALMLATCGVEVVVRLPDASYEASMLANDVPRFRVPVMVLAPEKVLLSAKSVDDANVHVEVEYEYVVPDELIARPPAARPESVSDGKEALDVAVRVPTVRAPAVVDERYVSTA